MREIFPCTVGGCKAVLSWRPHSPIPPQTWLWAGLSRTRRPCYLLQPYRQKQFPRYSEPQATSIREAKASRAGWGLTPGTSYTCGKSDTPHVKAGGGSEQSLSKNSLCLLTDKGGKHVQMALREAESPVLTELEVAKSAKHGLMSVGQMPFCVFHKASWRLGLNCICIAP